jgi:O-acetyl-ADP-ribose deacetylase
LRARHVIHTVGPVWRGGALGEPALLAPCYRNSLTLARDHGVRSIAFPAISCGVYGYPPEQASRIAVREVADLLAGEAVPERVLLVAFGASLLAVLQRAVAEAAC